MVVRQIDGTFSGWDSSGCVGCHHVPVGRWSWWWCGAGFYVAAATCALVFVFAFPTLDYLALGALPLAGAAVFCLVRARRGLTWSFATLRRRSRALLQRDRTATPDPLDGGFDEELWRRLLRIVLAAGAGDRRGYWAGLNALGKMPLERLRLAGFYVSYLLRYRIGSTLGHTPPTPDDVVGLSNRVRARFHELIPVNASLLDDTVRTACELSAPGTEVQGAEFQVRAPAILALLLLDPTKDLTAAKPHLIAYCARQADSIRRVCTAPAAPVGGT
jgi:hypothetical protein